MFYFSSLPLPYPLNPIIYLITLFPIIILLLTQLPKLFLIVFGVKLVIHVLDTFVNKKENQEEKENGNDVDLYGSSTVSPIHEAIQSSPSVPE